MPKKMNAFMMIAICMTITNAFGEDYVLPNHKIIGHSLDAAMPVILVPDEDAKVFPTSVWFDMRDGKVIGIVAEYPKKKDSYEAIERSVNKLHAKSLRSSDIATDISLSTWRDENLLFAIQLFEDHEDEEGPTLVFNKIMEKNAEQPAPVLPAESIREDGQQEER